MSKSLAIEYAKNININRFSRIHKTAMTDKIDDKFKEILYLKSSGRLGEPEDIANVVLFYLIIKLH